MFVLWLVVCGGFGVVYVGIVLGLCYVGLFVGVVGLCLGNVGG